MKKYKLKFNKNDYSESKARIKACMRLLKKKTRKYDIALIGTLTASNEHIHSRIFT